MLKARRKPYSHPLLSVSPDRHCIRYNNPREDGAVQPYLRPLHRTIGCQLNLAITIADRCRCHHRSNHPRDNPSFHLDSSPCFFLTMHEESSFYTRTSIATAYDAIPSFVPAKPSPSVVVAFTLIADTSTAKASAIFARIASICGASFGA